MNVLVSGAGIAGSTLAYWLTRAGHDVVMVERSPSLRGEGYMIDFFGSGYEVADRMGLLPRLGEIHYPIPRFAILAPDGRERFSIGYQAYRRLFDDRHFNFMRGDLAQVLYREIEPAVPVRFGTTIRSLETNGGRSPVRVAFSDGASGEFDLVVGADGVRSQVRELGFGDQPSPVRYLGYHTAAFIVDQPPAGLRAADALSLLTVPGRQVAVYPIRDGRLATFFVWKAARELTDFSPASAAAELRRVYRESDWIVPDLLERCEQSDIYYDDVSQVELSRWSGGRIVLVGDACHCVSLLAGQGASMAMAGGYILAGELARAGADLAAALARYEHRLRPAIERKQRAGRRLAGWFVPKSNFRRAVGDGLTRMAEWPIVWRLVKRAFAGDSVIGRG